MNLFHTIVLAIIEGLTEFLPISSTGHMILTAAFLKIPQTDFLKSFEIIIQFGAILAIVVLYWKKVLADREAWKKILAAFVPSAAVSFIVYKAVKTYLIGNVQVVLWSFLIGGIILIIFDLLHKDTENAAEEIGQISYKNAILIGLCQTIAVIPGVSRSAATIVGALALGEKRKTAVEFSFLLAVPTMLAASGYDLLKEKAHFSGQEYMLLGVGLIVAFVTALTAVKLFINYVKNNDFKLFGIYRILAAIVGWIILK
jgi:undecaprenyl-diphosphatase